MLKLIDAREPNAYHSSKAMQVEQEAGTPSHAGENRPAGGTNREVEHGKKKVAGEGRPTKTFVMVDAKMQRLTDVTLTIYA